MFCTQLAVFMYPKVSLISRNNRWNMCLRGHSFWNKVLSQSPPPEPTTFFPSSSLSIKLGNHRGTTTGHVKYTAQHDQGVLPSPVRHCNLHLFTAASHRASDTYYKNTLSSRSLRLNFRINSSSLKSSIKLKEILQLI